MPRAKDAATHLIGIVYDPQQREYYNIKSDIFLTEDDISYHKLKPYSEITSPLPNPLPTDYFKLSPS